MKYTPTLYLHKDNKPFTWINANALSWGAEIYQGRNPMEDRGHAHLNFKLNTNTLNDLRALTANPEVGLEINYSDESDTIRYSHKLLVVALPHTSFWDKLGETTDQECSISFRITEHFMFLRPGE